MADEQNVKVVQAAYAAFGRGDIAGVIDALDDSIIWRPTEGAAANVPTAGERRGKAGVLEFFRQLDESQKFEAFKPKELSRRAIK